MLFQAGGDARGAKLVEKAEKHGGGVSRSDPARNHFTFTESRFFVTDTDAIELTSIAS
jgi:hypothetical protein